jgi:hypothetical protein
MIPEPQRTYVLELLAALGSAAGDFVVAGAQAMKFAVHGARGTKDVDFILDVVALRAEPLALAETLQRLGYAPVEEARNFQFEKSIPNSREKMRIEFMAPEEYKRRVDFRVDVQDGVHARACAGGSIALAQSDSHDLPGTLPNGEKFTSRLRVTRPHALVLLKLLALSDRYSNIRGPREARHDREEAQTHATDIVAIISAQPDPAQFAAQFLSQFQADPLLGVRVLRILADSFRDTTSPGLIVYAEYLAVNTPTGHDTQADLRQETERARRVVFRILPPSEFLAIAAAIDDSSDWEKIPQLVEDYLSGLENARIAISDDLALGFLPAAAFGGAYKPGDTFITIASEAIQKLSKQQCDLLRAYLNSRAEQLIANPQLRLRFAHALQT